MAGDTAHLGPTVTSPRAGEVSEPGPAALGLAVENDPSSLDWLRMAVCPVGVRLSGTTIGWHESPPSGPGDAVNGEAGFWSILPFPEGDTTKRDSG